MLQWGIIGPGSIARVFCNGLRFSQTGRAAAVASRHRERAEQFAAQFSIPQAYGSYEELLADEKILAFRLNESRSFSVAGRFAPIRKVCVSCFGGLSPGLGALKPPFSRRDSVEPAFEGVL